MKPSTEQYLAEYHLVLLLGDPEADNGEKEALLAQCTLGQCTSIIQDLVTLDSLDALRWMLERRPDACHPPTFEDAFSFNVPGVLDVLVQHVSPALLREAFPRAANKGHMAALKALRPFYDPALDTTGAALAAAALQGHEGCVAWLGTFCPAEPAHATCVREQYWPAVDLLAPMVGAEAWARAMQACPAPCLLPHTQALWEGHLIRQSVGETSGPARAPRRL